MTGVAHTENYTLACWTFSPNLSWCAVEDSSTLYSSENESALGYCLALVTITKLRKLIKSGTFTRKKLLFSSNTFQTKPYTKNFQTFDR